MQPGTLEGGGGHLARAAGFALIAGFLAACSGDRSTGYQGYVEGEYVHVASAVGGRLERLLVERGQTVEAESALCSSWRPTRKRPPSGRPTSSSRRRRRSSPISGSASALPSSTWPRRSSRRRGRRGAGRAAAQARRSAVRGRRHRARAARRFARQPRASTPPGCASCGPARGVAAAGARGPDPRAGRPGRGRARRVEPVELAARPEARSSATPGRARRPTRCTAKASGCRQAARWCACCRRKNVKVRFFVPRSRRRRP